jgi:hypothetical protein
MLRGGRLAAKFRVIAGKLSSLPRKWQGIFCGDRRRLAASAANFAHETKSYCSPILARSIRRDLDGKMAALRKLR